MKQVAEEILEKLDDFYAIRVPDITEVVYKNGEVYKGFFEHFDDIDKLLEVAKCRFVPMNNSLAFSKETNDTGKLNPKYSIIIDLTQIRKVRLINRITKELVEEISFA